MKGSLGQRPRENTKEKEIREVAANYCLVSVEYCSKHKLNSNRPFSKGELAYASYLELVNDSFFSWALWVCFLWQTSILTFNVRQVSVDSSHFSMVYQPMGLLVLNLSAVGVHRYYEHGLWNKWLLIRLACLNESV